MSNCNPIRISNCPSGTGCDSCKEIVKAQCIKYVGNTLSYLDVHDGDLLKDILIKLNETVNVEGLTYIPQACVKLQKNGSALNEGNHVGYFYTFFSCSATDIPLLCTRSYKMFDDNNVEIFSGTLSQCYSHTQSLTFESSYSIVEYITCPTGTSQSLNMCFKIIQLPDASFTLRFLYPSCDCCSATNAA